MYKFINPLAGLKWDVNHSLNSTGHIQFFFLERKNELLRIKTLLPCPAQTNRVFKSNYTLNGSNFSCNIQHFLLIPFIWIAWFSYNNFKNHLTVLTNCCKFIRSYVRYIMDINIRLDVFCFLKKGTTKKRGISWEWQNFTSYPLLTHRKYIFCKGYSTESIDDS